MTHKEAFNALNLKIGDKVRIVRRRESFSGGWKNKWTKEMDDWMGETIVVKELDGSIGVRMAEINGHSYWFPADSLEIVSRVQKAPLLNGLGIRKRKINKP